MNIGTILIIAQLLCALAVGIYFFTQYRSQKTNKNVVEKSSDKELEKLRLLRRQKLTQPLNEKTRPDNFNDIIGQQEGIKALKAALCGANPQHVLIYGPPGVGKTCAARLVLESAKKNVNSPFNENAKFIEIDATCVRFDERAIADPLIGSVHDPIYQGSGAMGAAGVPQPKPGAVTKANGGVLFLDEIGELHPMQMNKLLKVLEDRKVCFESAYYNSDDKNIPPHIRDIFEHGLPADFRLIGATTRQPSDIPPALRSRCVELYFRGLRADELSQIAKGASEKTGIGLSEQNSRLAANFCQNGRDTVNMIQLAAGLVMDEGRNEITNDDIEWVVETCRYSPRYEKKISDRPQIGLVNGLAVTGDGAGMLLEVEVFAQKCKGGKVHVNGIIEQEEMGNNIRRLRRKSTAKSSVENVMCALKNCFGVDASQYDIYINFPGGVPVDGPSAGVALAMAVYSAIKGISCDHKVAMTGEVSIRGEVLPVGGVMAKAEAAILAGANRVLVPQENYRAKMANLGAEVIAISSLKQAFSLGFNESFEDSQDEAISINLKKDERVIAAQGADA